MKFLIIRYLKLCYSRLLKLRNINFYARIILSKLPFIFYSTAFQRYTQNKTEDLPFLNVDEKESYHKFYGFDFVKPYFENLKLKNTTPTYVIHKNVTYYPSKEKPLVNSGLFDSTGNIIMESCLFRGRDKSERITEIKTYNTYLKKIRLNGSYIYGGPLAPHYGHFLTECIGRLWYLLDEQKTDSFLLFHGDKSTLKIDFVKEILHVLPIEKERIIILDCVTELEEVAIPFPSMTNRGEIYSIHKKLPTKVAESILSSQKINHTDQPLYLSRRKLPLSNRNILNERKLEECLKSNNVKIIYPEELSFTEQVILFNRHRVVIGPLGSAHHTTMFSLDKLTQVYLCHAATMQNYYMVDYINNNSSYYIMCCYRPFWENRPLNLSSLIINIDYLVSCLKSIGVI